MGRTSKSRKKFWEKHLKAHSESGLTQKAYCQKYGFSYNQFQYWKRKIATAGQPLVELTGLLDNSAPDKRPGFSGKFEIILGETNRLIIPDNFSPETLKKILQVIGG